MLLKFFIICILGAVYNFLSNITAPVRQRMDTDDNIVGLSLSYLNLTATLLFLLSFFPLGPKSVNLPPSELCVALRDLFTFFETLFSAL